METQVIGPEAADDVVTVVHAGFGAREHPRVTLMKVLPVTVETRSGDEARALGEALAPALQAGDLLILTGDLGAGKTTFTQGIGAGLGVRGDVTSPTFVISRVHPSLGDGPPLVHVDAYRLSGGSGAGVIDELDDLDLDASLDEAVTVVEWGEGVAEGLADTRLEVRIKRARGDEAEDKRTVTFVPVGARWVDADLRKLLTGALA